VWYLIQKIRDENGDVISHKVLGKSQTPFATKTDHENVWHTDENHELLRVVVDGNGDAVLDDMNNLQLEDDTNAVSIAAQEEEIAIRVKRIEFGHRLVAIMSIRNDAKSLSQSEIVQLVNDFADINKAWLNGSIQTSRALIDALTPDETILTTADKVAILAEIDSKLTALGY